MKQQNRISLVVIAMCVAIANAAIGTNSIQVRALQNNPGLGNCGTGENKVESPSNPYTYNAVSPVTSLIIKAGSQNQGQACFTFTSNGNDGCYSVSGLGTTSVTVAKIGSGPNCKDISHIEFYMTPTSPSPSPVVSPCPNVCASPSPKPSPTPHPSSTPGVPSPHPTPSVKPTPSPSPRPCISPKPSPSPRPTPTVSPSPRVSPSPEVSPTPGVSPTPSPEVSPSPEVTPTPTPTPTPSASPEATPGTGGTGGGNDNGGSSSSSSSSSSGGTGGGDVLGASTLADTGTANDVIAILSTMAGMTMSTTAVYGYRKSKKTI